MEKNGRTFDPLLFSFVDETLLEKNVPTLMEKTVHASSPRIPSSRIHLFSQDNRVMDPSLVHPLEEENKKKAKEIRDHFHSLKKERDAGVGVGVSWSWIQEFMENPYYKNHSATMKSGLLPIVVDVYEQLGMRTNEEKLLRELEGSMNETVFNICKEKYETVRKTLHEDAEKIKALETAHKQIKEKYEHVTDREQKKQCVEMGKKLKAQYEALMKERAIMEQLGSRYHFVRDANNWASWKAKRKEAGYGPGSGLKYLDNELMLSLLEPILNIKFIILDEEAYKSGDYSHILSNYDNGLGVEIKSQMEDVGDNDNGSGTFIPEYYILLEKSKENYRLISYKNKKSVQYHEIPYDLKRMILEKCVEGGGCGFEAIPFFQEKKGDRGRGEIDIDDFLESKIMNLFDENVVFVFYDKSSHLVPGKGHGEKIDPEENMRAYAALANREHWRRKLSNTWVEHPFTIDNHRWASVIHYNEACKYKKTEFYLNFSLDSGTELSKKIVMALAAGSPSGKYRGELLRPLQATLDDEYNEKKSIFNAQMAKFTQHLELRDLLLETGRAKLMHFKRGERPVCYDSLMMVRETIRRRLK